MKRSAAKKAGGAALGVLALTIGVVAYFNLSHSGISRSAAQGSPSQVIQVQQKNEPPRVERSGTNELIVPAVVVEKMGLSTAKASVATHSIPLPSFQGVLALDNDQLSRVHSRFDGEVVEIGHSTDGSDPTLRVGDCVQRGDLLAVIWSADLGQKKSELVGSLNKLRSEEQLRDRLKKLYEEGAGAGRNYRDAEKDVQARLGEVASIERTLRTWRLSEEDIAEVREGAAHIALSDSLPDDKNSWARVEVRAPMSGVILEKNIVVGDIVDNSADLFKIGQMSHLVVWAHVYEEDLPLLESLPRPIQWVVSRPSNPSETFSGTLDKVSAVIDPVQHTALVTGRVENTAGELKVGQFVTVTVKKPPSDHELELPATAIVEDEWQSVVFVRSKSDETRFVRCPVQVIRRFRDEIYIQTGKSGIQPGDLVVTSGALMLQNAMDQLAAPSIASREAAIQSESPSALPTQVPVNSLSEPPANENAG